PSGKSCETGLQRTDSAPCCASILTQKKDFLFASPHLAARVTDIATLARDARMDIKHRHRVQLTTVFMYKNFIIFLNCATLHTESRIKTKKPGISAWLSRIRRAGEDLHRCGTTDNVLAAQPQQDHVRGNGNG